MRRRREVTASGATLVVVGSVVRHWTRAVVANPRGVVVLSPFITSKTAESVLGNASGHSVRVYTVFDSSVFASGASQISTLRRLAEAGHRIFHVARLHAKIVLTRTTATVGSQNLTSGGQSNRETTVVLNNSLHVAGLRRDLAAWLRGAERISIERIREMERSLGQLQRTFRQFKSEAQDLDDAVAARARSQRRRVAKENSTLARERRRRVEDEERLARIRRLLAASDRSDQAIQMRIVQWPYETLVCRQQSSDLTSWWMTDGTPVTLTTRRRYLVVSPAGRIAWPALNKTRLTQFGSRLVNDDFEVDGRTIRLSFTAFQTPREGDANVELELRINEHDAPVTLTAWFDLQRVELREQRVPEFEQSSLGSRWLAQQLEHRREEILAVLAGRLLRPFRYAANSYGQTATQFLGANRSFFALTLRRRADLVFFALE